MNVNKRNEAVAYLKNHLKDQMVPESIVIPFYERLEADFTLPTPGPFVPLVPLFKRKFEEDADWFVKGHHLHMGMGLRNLLRSQGYGEKELEVENLDDYYIDILKEALE